MSNTLPNTEVWVKHSRYCFTFYNVTFVILNTCTVRIAGVKVQWKLMRNLKVGNKIKPVNRLGKTQDAVGGILEVTHKLDVFMITQDFCTTCGK